MTRAERRREIIRIISESEAPVPAKELARLCDVSRQVIVQDMVLIRETGIDIIATNRGYIVNAPYAARRKFKVSHTDEQMEDELCSIVDILKILLLIITITRLRQKMRRSWTVSKGCLRRRGIWWRI